MSTTSTLKSIIAVSILFHDIGKVLISFQKKLLMSAKGKDFLDPVRHEFFSTMVCDELFGSVTDDRIKDHLLSITDRDIDQAVKKSAEALSSHFKALKQKAHVNAPFKFTQAQNNHIARTICSLVLSHHRLPDANETLTRFRSRNHVTFSNDATAKGFFAAEKGRKYWKTDWFKAALIDAAHWLDPLFFNEQVTSYHGRTFLMLADHIGSSRKQKSAFKSGILMANTIEEGGVVLAADTLDAHVKKVLDAFLEIYDSLLTLSNLSVSVQDHHIPKSLKDIAKQGAGKFHWQRDAADLAAEVSGHSSGGFFACLVAGTGTGKTRAAPAVLLAAARNDADISRRSFRFSLGLGLRTLATQSAKEYVNDIGFASKDVSVLVGTPPITFPSHDDDSGSLDQGYDILDAAGAEESDPVPGFLRGYLDASSGNYRKLETLLAKPVVCATIDHFMGIAAPLRSRHLVPALRLLTSDIILDEIDQYGAEDISAIARLAYHIGLSGRRLIIMSATVTSDVTSCLFEAYSAGWRAFASFSGCGAGVHALVASDAPDGAYAKENCEDIGGIFDLCTKRTCAVLARSDTYRRSEVLDPAESWNHLVDQIDATCSVMHDRHGYEISGVKVSVGFVKMTRIAHTAAMAHQLPGGPIDGRLRLKVCLHSAFPRINRAWIEDQMKSILTRKGRNPNDQIAHFVADFDLDHWMRVDGITDLEIVFIVSPVLETGNDVDFDYAIIDPMDVRSIVQAAGRVNRHRKDRADVPNVAILGRPVICMESGTLAYPGVETPQAKETYVCQINIMNFKKDDIDMSSTSRNFTDLMGQKSVDVIDARLILEPGAQTPFLAADAVMRDAFINGRFPVSVYCSNQIARFSTRYPKSRMFRRSEGENAEIFLQGRDVDSLHWMIDLHPSDDDSVPTADPHLHDRRVDDPDFLFMDVFPRAIEAKFGSKGPAPSKFRSMTATSIRDPFFGDEDRVDLPDYHCSHHLGIVKGHPDCVTGPFGRH